MVNFGSVIKIVGVVKRFKIQGFIRVNIFFILFFYKGSDEIINRLFIVIINFRCSNFVIGVFIDVFELNIVKRRNFIDFGMIII